MKTPHKWAKEICHLANGGEIEVRSNIEMMPYWRRMNIVQLHYFECAQYEFRIKPERVYPVTSLTAEDVAKIYKAADGHYSAIIAVVNAAIRQHIIDTEGQP